MADPQTRVTGAGPAGTAPPRRPWWLWIVPAVVVIAILVFGLVRCGAGSGTGQDSTAASATPSAAPLPAGTGPGAATTAPSAGEPSTSAAAGPPAASTAPAAPATGAGSLTAGDTALLPVSAAAGPNGDLSALVGRAVTGHAVPVQSVVANEGFWIGTSATDRVFVELTVPPGESSYQVREGQTVDLSGTMTAHDAGYAAQQGVDAVEGADQLTRQAAHLAVAKADLHID